MSPEIRKRRPAKPEADGGVDHLMDIYAHNTVKEIIKKARDVLESGGGPVVLPRHFLDRLIVDCEKWILDEGDVRAEALCRESIAAFLSEMERFKREDDERKVRSRMPKAPRTVE
jgi:hypothetical protein